MFVLHISMYWSLFEGTLAKCDRILLRMISTMPLLAMDVRLPLSLVLLVLCIETFTNVRPDWCLDACERIQAQENDR